MVTRSARSTAMRGDGGGGAGTARDGAVAGALAQAVVAAAADVALVGLLRVVGVCLTAAAHLIGAVNAGFLCYVVNRMTVVAIGHCAAQYVGDLVVAYVFMAVAFAALLGVSLAVTFY